MKTIPLLARESCPDCQKARAFMQELCNEHPEYARLPVELVEEGRQRALADSFDYYYVPCYYIDGAKVAEGSIDKDGVRKVFDEAMNG
jgi:glutaredoxin